ncbi:sulfatase-like hydrolase/transferase [Paenibacillus sp. GCM10027626]|uniref:sulfatase-like hydrolase/transferase n=1 Tax=Paenibacillus sp. GCM10027626 TaxID=3273411 RepID=UPI00363BBAC7
MKKPNIVLIMCDQLRADVLGCYGSDFVKTPNIDKLAEQGVRFDRIYSQTPVCVPARHGLIAGKAPFQLGLTDNTALRHPIEHPLPQILRNEGYFTCAVGKMHFSPPRAHHGFDRMLLSEEIPGHFDDDDYLQYLASSGFMHIREPHGKRREMYYVPQVSELPEAVHTTAWTAETACEQIRKNKDRPFFLFTSFIKPHPPFDPCQPYDTMYPLDQVPAAVRSEQERAPIDLAIAFQNDYKINGIDSLTPEQEKQIRAYYYGSVTQIDVQIKKIMDTLERYGLADNTLVILTADHGEMLGDHYSYGKRTFYEPSARIPLLMRWPERLPQGVQRKQLGVLTDVYATIADAAGARDSS